MYHVVTHCGYGSRGDLKLLPTVPEIVRNGQKKMAVEFGFGDLMTFNHLFIQVLNPFPTA